MKLSQSTNFITRKSSSKNKLNTSRKKYSEQIIFKDDNIDPIKIMIKIEKNDELQPSFVDAFTKTILNNNNFQLTSESYNNVKVTTYSQFYETLKNFGNQINIAKPWKDNNQHLSNLKGQQTFRFKKAQSYQNVRKRSVDEMPRPERRNYLFSFEAYNNSIILLLDLSPYMLLYDYSTKSFVLQNMQEIVRDLFLGLQRHYNQRKIGASGPAYFISCYAFSIYKKQVQQVMRDQEIFFSESHQIKFKNKDLISDYICAFINRSKLPHTLCKGQKPVPISQIIQKVLNLQEGHSGIKSFVTISAFKQLDTSPYIFFSSNWYTYCFICAGELNFGSILVDSSEVYNKFSKSSYLQTKFVFKCMFLQNWQKVQLIQSKDMRPKYLDSSLQKSRAILYVSSKGEKKQSIFEDLLRFNLKINDKKKKNQGITTNKSESAVHVHKNQKILHQHQFNIPLQNITQIMRTKYLQGWQQVPVQNYQKNTKYAFKLEFANGVRIIYNAINTQQDFKVNISSISSDLDLNNQLEHVKSQRKWIVQMIKKIDIINTSNFDIITAFKNKNTTKSDNKIKNDRNYKIYLNFDSRGYESMHILNQIITKHDQWNCYFKVRKLYIHFIPNEHYLNELNQLLNQFRYFFGERISHLCFMQRKKIVDHGRQRQSFRWHTIFVKVSGILHFLEIKFGFLKYTDAQIKVAIQNIQNKLSSKKLMNGSIKIVPEQIYSYCFQKFVPSNATRKNLSSIFERNWKINFKNEYLCRVFKHINTKIIKKLGYNFLCQKHQRIFYFKIISVVQKQNKKDKGVFLQIKCLNNNLIQFKVEAFPSFSFIQNLVNSYISQPISDKSIYNITQKSITSSNSQMSISANSLPNISSFSNKEISSSNKTPQSQIQGKYKNSFLELFNILVQQIKQSQKRLVNLIKCQTQIYDFLIKKRIEQNKSGIQDEELIQKIKNLYGISANNFQSEYINLLMHIKKQHYTQEFNQIQKVASTSSKKANNRNIVQPSVNYNPLTLLNIDQIPQPKHFLMQSPIFNIQGDLVLASKSNPTQKYKFFLLTPNTAAYVWKKPQSYKIFFRLMKNIYSRTQPTQKDEGNLRKNFEEELKKRINKQLKQQQYLTFYNLIAQQKQSDQLLLFTAKNRKERGNQILSYRNLVKILQLDFSSFTGVNINCTQILNIYFKQQNSNLQQRMFKILLQFKDKFFYYLSILFLKSTLQLDSQLLTAPSKSSSQRSNNRQTRRQMQMIRFKSLKQEEQPNKRFRNTNNNNYYYEKKVLNLQENFITEMNLNNVVNFDNSTNFENIILKICTNKGLNLTQDNFMSLFANKFRKSSQEIQPKQLKTQIHINFFGYKVTRFCKKIQWLNKIIIQLVNQCMTYLRLVTLTQSNDIKEMENKLRDCIIKGPSEKIPDDVWNQPEIIRQIESGHMKSIIPFYQYSFKPSPAKFIAREMQIITQSSSKSNQLMYLKYWLTMQITPSRVLKTKVIPFKHISLVSEIILNVAESNNYQMKMKIMINNYISELIKFLKVKNIFKTIQSKLYFPENPSIPLFINNKIMKRLQQQKRKQSKTKMPKKWHGIELKSLIGTSNQNFIQSTPGNQSFTPSPNNISARLINSVPQQKIEIKNYLKLSLIYQESITYFQKFQSFQILSRLACCEKLNAYAIRNLQNTYIFFNPELKQYFIFYLEQSSSSNNQINETHSATHKIRSQKTDPQVSNIQSLNDSHQLSQLNLTNAFSQTFIQKQKRKNYSFTYSVYCIDKTVSKADIQKLHGQLIRKAVQEVTFDKVAKILSISTQSLNYKPIIIDQPQQEYFREGEKKKLIFQIPYIGLKSNLKQYFKQHIQNSFYHRKAQFRSSMRRKQNQKANELELIQQKQTKDDKKISTKKKRQSTILNSCNQKCISQTWIFQTTKSHQKSHQKPHQLEHIFGNFMFLAQIQVVDRFPSCQNACFWKRHTQKQQKFKGQKDKNYIYSNILTSLIKNSSKETETKQQNLIKHYLQQFEQKQLKQKKSIKTNQSFSKTKSSSRTTISFNNGQGSRKSQSQINSFQSKVLESIINQYAQKSITQNQNYSLIVIDILSVFGSSKYKVIERFYKQLIYYSLFDYYFQIRLFRQLFANFNLSSKNSRQNNLRVPRHRSIKDYSDIQMKKKPNQIYNIDQDEVLDTKNTLEPLSLHRTQSSPTKIFIDNKQSFILLPNDDFTDKIYQSYLDIFLTIQKQIPINRTSCVNMYRTQNKVLIQKKNSAILSLLRIVIQIFKRNLKINDNYAIKLIVYGIQRNVTKIHFWGLQYDTNLQNKQQKKCKIALSLQQIDYDIAKYNLQFSRMGFFFCDYLFDLDSLRQHLFHKENLNKNQQIDLENLQWETFNRTDVPDIQFQWMKKLSEGHSFCQTEYYFKRSLALHYEVSESSFLCFSYNFKDKDVQDLFTHLEQMETWYSQKNRLLNFILKIKKNEKKQIVQYEIPPPTQQNSFKKYQIGNIYSTKKFKQVSRPQIQIKLTNLLKSLVFDQLPFENFKSSMRLIQKMYKILSYQTISYANYEEYKGKQSSKLEKIGRQYMSILRYEFGVQKIHRRESICIKQTK